MRGDYGVDAPAVPLFFALASLGSLVGGVLGFSRGVIWLGACGVAYALMFALSTASYLYTTRRGKLLVWAQLLDELRLRGDERLLDVGCGRGAVLLTAARRLARATSIGLDRWSRVDQSGNAGAVTLRNAEREGVAARVALTTADMRTLPFADGSFDVVVSSLAIHNVPDRQGRRRAVEEIARVLKPGGVALLADFRFTADYRRWLEEKLGAAVERRRLGWRFWYGGPHASTSLVIARKPAQ